MAAYDLELRKFRYQRNTSARKGTPAEVSAPAGSPTVTTIWRCRECGAEYAAGQVCDACGTAVHLFDRTRHEFVEVEATPKAAPEGVPEPSTRAPGTGPATPPPAPASTRDRRNVLIREGNAFSDDGRSEEAITRYRTLEEMDRASLLLLGRTPERIDNLRVSLSRLHILLLREGRSTDALALMPEIASLQSEIESLESSRRRPKVSPAPATAASRPPAPTRTESISMPLPATAHPLVPERTAPAPTSPTTPPSPGPISRPAPTPMPPDRMRPATPPHSRPTSRRTSVPPPTTPEVLPYPTSTLFPRLSGTMVGVTKWLTSPLNTTPLAIRIAAVALLLCLQAACLTVCAAAIARLTSETDPRPKATSRVSEPAPSDSRNYAR